MHLKTGQKQVKCPGKHPELVSTLKDAKTEVRGVNAPSAL